MNEDGHPSKFWAYIAALVGGLLLLAGMATTVSFLGLPLFLGGDILGPQLGQIAGMFLGLVCGSLALFHGLRSILKRRSSSLRLPPIITFLLIFALVLGLGNLVINFEIATELLFPPLFVLGAALPTVVVLAWVGRKLGWPITWRQGALAFVAGCTLSIIVAILLQTILPYVVYSLLMPLEYSAYSFSELASGTSGFLERLFSSPLIVIFLIITAFQAPIPEEFAKALGITMFGRKRVLEERQAFMIGLASGAGFAILENMLYEGVYAQWSGWTWGGVTLIRGIGSILHPLCTAIVTLGWFRARKMGWGTLLKAYFLAIGLHTLWNGGFLSFIYLTGLDYYAISESSLSVYGLVIEALLVIFLIVLSIGLWWLLSHLVSGMAEDTEPELATMVISPRALALWGLACVLVIVPIGAALGPAWHQIRAVVFGGL